MNLLTGKGIFICSFGGICSGLVCAAISDASLAEFAIMSLAWILIFDRIATEDDK